MAVPVAGLPWEMPDGAWPAPAWSTAHRLSEEEGPPMRPKVLLPAALVIGAAGAALATWLPSPATTTPFDFPPEWDRKAALENGWIYDDLDSALEKAKETGKPILAVLRCPP